MTQQLGGGWASVAAARGGGRASTGDDPPPWERCPPSLVPFCVSHSRPNLMPSCQPAASPCISPLDGTDATATHCDAARKRSAPSHLRTSRRPFAPSWGRGVALIFWSSMRTPGRSRTCGKWSRCTTLFRRFGRHWDRKMYTKSGWSRQCGRTHSGPA